MSRRRSIMKFAISCLLVYSAILLAGHYLGLHDSFTSKFRQIGNASFGQWSNAKSVRFSAIKQAGLDTKVSIVNRQIAKKHSFQTSSWYLAFLPLAMLLSLILAQPYLSYARKIIALGLGSLLIYVAVHAYLSIKIHYLFYECDRAVAGFEPSVGSRCMDFLNAAIMDNTGLVLVVPVLIWLLLAVDLRQINHAFQNTKHSSLGVGEQS